MKRRGFLGIVGAAAAGLFVRKKPAPPSIAEMNERDMDDIRRRYADGDYDNKQTFRWKHTEHWTDPRNWSGSVSVQGSNSPTLG